MAFNVRWSQRRNVIQLFMDYPSVSSENHDNQPNPQFETSLMDNKILRLSGGPVGNQLVDIPLFKETTDVIDIKVTGVCVQVRIAKQPGDVEYWPCLLDGPSANVRTHVDWETWMDEDEDEGRDDVREEGRFEYPSFHDAGCPPSNGEWIVPGDCEDDEEYDSAVDDCDYDDQLID